MMYFYMANHANALHVDMKFIRDIMQKIKKLYSLKRLNIVVKTLKR